MATITGFIEKIKFRNEENGYTIMTVINQSDGDEVVMVGTVSYAAEGDMIQATGHMTEHPVYGEQLQIERYELKNPEDAASMERYLGSGAIFLVNFGSQIQGDPVGLKEHHGLTHILLFLNLFSDGHRHFFADAPDF